MGFSYFFRDVAVMDLIVKHVLPEVKSNKYITIWSAGCSEGQEPYTLAIKIRENVKNFTFRRMRIIATDIDNTTGKFGEMVTTGVYPKKMVERVDPNIVSCYFKKLNGGIQYELIPEIKNVVEFHKHDLLTYQPIKNGIDIILCKNVLMHFNKEQRVKVIDMFYNALNKQGYLAMERTQKLPEEVRSKFERVTNNGQIFRRI